MGGRRGNRVRVQARGYARPTPTSSLIQIFKWHRRGRKGMIRRTVIFFQREQRGVVVLSRHPGWRVRDRIPPSSGPPPMALGRQCMRKGVRESVRMMPVLKRNVRPMVRTKPVRACITVTSRAEMSLSPQVLATTREIFSRHLSCMNHYFPTSYNYPFFLLFSGYEANGLTTPCSPATTLPSNRPTGFQLREISVASLYL